MSDSILPRLSRSRVCADLTDVEVGTDDEKGDESVILLRLHVLRADGVEFRKRGQWDLLVGRDDLVHIAQKILAALE